MPQVDQPQDDQNANDSDNDGLTGVETDDQEPQDLDDSSQSDDTDPVPVQTVDNNDEDMTIHEGENEDEEKSEDEDHDSVMDRMFNVHSKHVTNVPEPRCSARETRPVKRLEPKMTGKSYLQATKDGMKPKPQVPQKTIKFADHDIEQCHNLVTQVHPNPEEDVDYATDHALLIACMMTKLNQHITMKGAAMCQA